MLSVQIITEFTQDTHTCVRYISPPHSIQKCPTLELTNEIEQSSGFLRCWTAGVRVSNRFYTCKPQNSHESPHLRRQNRCLPQHSNTRGSTHSILRSTVSLVNTSVHGWGAICVQLMCFDRSERINAATCSDVSHFGYGLHRSHGPSDPPFRVVKNLLLFSAMSKESLRAAVAWACLHSLAPKRETEMSV